MGCVLVLIKQHGLKAFPLPGPNLLILLHPLGDKRNLVGEIQEVIAALARNILLHQWNKTSSLPPVVSNLLLSAAHLFLAGQDLELIGLGMQIIGYFKRLDQMLSARAGKLDY